MNAKQYKKLVKKEKELLDLIADIADYEIKQAGGTNGDFYYRVLELVAMTTTSVLDSAVNTLRDLRASNPNFKEVKTK